MFSHEATPGYLPDNFRGMNDEFWIPIQEGELVAVGCGDDRKITEQSARYIQERTAAEIMPLDTGFASIYGGKSGVEHTLLIAGVAAHGERFINNIGGLQGAEDTVSLGMNGMGILHSDVVKEEDTHRLLGTGSVGCAYNELRGATSFYLDADPSKSQEDRAIISNIIDVAQENQDFIFGENGEMVEKLLLGNKVIAKYLGNVTSKNSGIVDARNYSVSRQEYEHRQRFGTLTAILEGSHATAPKTGLVFNADFASVGSANKAVEGDAPMYRSDFLAITDMMGDVLQMHNIPTELFARAIALNATPVRAALVSHDSDPKLAGKLDPTPLAIGVRGNVRESLGVLADRYDALSL